MRQSPIHLRPGVVTRHRVSLAKLAKRQPTLTAVLAWARTMAWSAFQYPLTVTCASSFAVMLYMASISVGAIFYWTFVLGCFTLATLLVRGFAPFNVALLLKVMNSKTVILKKQGFTVGHLVSLSYLGGVWWFFWDQNSINNWIFAFIALLPWLMMSIPFMVSGIVAAVVVPVIALLVVRPELLVSALLVISLVLAVESFLHNKSNWLYMWSIAAQFRRGWPADYYTVSAKSRAIQASRPGGENSVSGQTIEGRPLLDHPALSILPRVDLARWTVSWRIFAPPGRTFDELDAILAQLGANEHFAASFHLVYGEPSDTFGRLVMSLKPLNGSAAEDAPPVEQMPYDTYLPLETPEKSVSIGETRSGDLPFEAYSGGYEPDRKAVVPPPPNLLEAINEESEEL